MRCTLCLICDAFAPACFQDYMAKQEKTKKEEEDAAAAAAAKGKKK